MGLFSRKHKNDNLLKTFDGRELKYVTKNTSTTKKNCNMNFKS